MKYFMNCKSLEDLKAEYRRLVKLHHPDCGGDTVTMQAINDEHDRVFEILKKQHQIGAGMALFPYIVTCSFCL